MGEGSSVQPSAARLYAGAVGTMLILFGMAGFFYSASFATGDMLVAEKAFGLFYVNGWANLLHLLAGTVGLVLMVPGPRLYCFAAGAVWALLAAFGYFGAHGGELIPAIGGMIPAGGANNLLALALSGLAFAAVAASAPRRKRPAKPTRVPRERKRRPAREKDVTEMKEPGESAGSAESQEKEPTGSIGRPRSAGKKSPHSRRTIN